MVAQIATSSLRQDRQTDVMKVCEGVEPLEFDKQFALFHQDRQQLVELNDTARLIWKRLAAGEPVGAAVVSLMDQGAGPEQARQYVSDALQRWLSEGWLAPAVLPELLDAVPQTTVGLSILGIGFRVVLHGGPTPAGVVDLLAPLQGQAPEKHRLDLVGWDNRHLLLIDLRSRGLFDPEEIAPAIKAALTERLAHAVADSFLAHGALLDSGGDRLLLAGAPGAGKSTLAMALVEAGFDCLCDDIVQVHADGQMQGAPFAPTLKSGAWPLLPSLALERLPIHRRADGRQVRYLPASISVAGARPLTHFVALSRQAAGAAELTPLSGLEAMRMVLEGGLAASGQISAAEVGRLAGTLAGASCQGLRYSNLPDAVQTLNRLVRG